MRSFVADPVSEVISEHGEGPRWDAGREELASVDLMAGVVHRHRLSGGRLQLVRSYTLGQPVGAVNPVAAGDGWLLAAGLGFVHLAEDGSATQLLELDPASTPDQRMNDAVCDPAGRMWAGTMAYDQSPGMGRLLRCDPGGSVTVVGSEFTVPNGMAWSPDGRTMYHADSGTKVLRAYPFDAGTGHLGAARVVVEFGEGAPADGITVDDEGMVWAAMYGGGEVRRYDPDGRVLAVVELPVTSPTAPCFGPGTTLFVTTTRQGMTPEQLAAEPDSGRVFAVDVGVGGPPVRPFSGALPASVAP